ncbi:hypothetical protein BD413DRAFT_267446 [Trametes elegans]|nr:hypothetical protein BD413DRAFT_267446 [Trametes elegans]
MVHRHSEPELFQLFPSVTGRTSPRRVVQFEAVVHVQPYVLACRPLCIRPRFTYVLHRIFPETVARTPNSDGDPGHVGVLGRASDVDGRPRGALRPHGRPTASLFQLPPRRALPAISRCDSVSGQPSPVQIGATRSPRCGGVIVDPSSAITRSGRHPRRRMSTLLMAASMNGALS